MKVETNNKTTERLPIIYLIIFIPLLIITFLCSLIIFLSQDEIFKKIDINSSNNISEETQKQDNYVTAKVAEKDAELFLEIADNDIERIRGLQGRDDLNENEGMLFIFQEEGMRSFWMFNTPISLDIAFLNEDKEIINIHRNTEPKNTSIRYKSDSPAKYVIETNAGWFETYHIEAGDIFSF